MFAGLPNITGMLNGIASMFRAVDTFEQGALYWAIRDGGNRATSTQGHTDGCGYPGFDASRSNPIYGGSPTVQPRSYGVLPCVYLGS